MTERTENEIMETAADVFETMRDLGYGDRVEIEAGEKRVRELMHDLWLLKTETDR